MLEDRHNLLLKFIFLKGRVVLQNAFSQVNSANVQFLYKSFVVERSLSALFKSAQAEHCTCDHYKISLLDDSVYSNSLRNARTWLVSDKSKEASSAMTSKTVRQTVTIYVGIDYSNSCTFS